MSVSGFAQLRRRLRALQKAPPKGLTKIQLDAVANAKALVPRKTGNLGRSIRRGPLTRSYAIVVAGANYAGYLEHGTRGGQIIVPKRAKVLAWGGPRRLSGALRRGGKPTHFAMRVKRGATKAQPFLVPGAKKALEDNTMQKVIVHAWNDAA